MASTRECDCLTRTMDSAMKRPNTKQKRKPYTWGGLSHMCVKQAREQGRAGRAGAGFGARGRTTSAGPPYSMPSWKTPAESKGCMHPMVMPTEPGKRRPACQTGGGDRENPGCREVT